MSVAQILVLMDFKKGFPPGIEIVTPGGQITQLLDYEGIPFRCHRCHHYGHMVADCSLTPQTYPNEGLEGETFVSPKMDLLNALETTGVEGATLLVNLKEVLKRSGPEVIEDQTIPEKDSIPSQTLIPSSVSQASLAVLCVLRYYC